MYYWEMIILGHYNPSLSERLSSSRKVLYQRFHCSIFIYALFIASPPNYRICEVLGSGAFGAVYKGVWYHTETDSDQRIPDEVAVKTINQGAGEEERIIFLQEAAIMGQFDHPNIIRLLGVMLDSKLEVSIARSSLFMCRNSI